MMLEDRKSQLFPTLTPRQLEFAVRFATGPARRFEADEKVFDVGDRNAGVWLVAEGGIIATRRDGLGRELLFATCGPGQFSGEVSELGGQASLAAACAASKGCVAYPFDAPHLRALLIGSADIGELMMRAFILRRVALLEGGSVGSVILGEAGSSDTVHLRDLLFRNGYPHSFIAADGPEGKGLVGRLGVQSDDLPILICPNGKLLRRPGLHRFPPTADRTLDIADIGRDNRHAAGHRLDHHQWERLAVKRAEDKNIQRGHHPRDIRAETEQDNMLVQVSYFKLLN